MRSKTSKGLAAIIAALLCISAFAGSASAAYDVYWEGWGDGFIAAPPHTLVKNSSRTISGGVVCVIGYRPAGAAWGPSMCTSGAGNLAWVNYARVFLQGATQTGGAVNFRSRVDF